MSLVKEAIQSLIVKGKMVHNFSMQGIEFEMEPITAEEQLLVDGLVDPEKIKQKYKADGLNILRDTVDKYRSISQVAFAIKKVNGQSPVDTQAPLEDQFKQRMEFRDELVAMGTVMMDKFAEEYAKAYRKQRVFLDGVNENAGK